MKKKTRNILDEIEEREMKGKSFENFAELQKRIGGEDDDFFKPHLVLDKKAERKRAKRFKKAIRAGFRADFAPSM